jgi:WD40 repeat protein
MDRSGGDSPEVVEIAERGAAGPIRRLVHPGPVHQVLFAADGRTLLAIMKDHGIRRWDVARGEASGPRFHPEGLETGDLRRVTFRRDRFRASRDGTVLILVDRTESLQVWDTTAGRRLLGPLQTSKDLPVIFGDRATAGLITNAAVSPDGRRVAAASASTGTLAVWDVPTGRLLHANAKRFRGFSDDLDFSPDGRWVLVISSDTVARAWSAESGELAGPPLHHPGSVLAGDVAPDGQRIATQAKAEIYLWDRATGDLLSRLALSEGVFPKTGEVRPLFSADGRRLTLTDGTTTVTTELPVFRAPLDTLAPLAELLTCQRLDEFGGAEFVDQGAILADPARYRRAWLARRGLDDDLAAQPVRLQGP